MWRPSTKQARTSSFVRLHLDLDLLHSGSNSSGNSSGLLNGPIVQKIRYFMAGSGSGSEDLDLLNPSGLVPRGKMHPVRLMQLNWFQF